MRSVDDWLDEYGESHRHPTNKAIHYVCVPLIMMSLLGLLACLPGPREGVSWAMVVMALAVLYYARLSVRLALGMAVMAFGMLYGVGLLESVADVVPLWASSSLIFVGAWIGQFIGHGIEGKKPSFFKDLQFLMIGPLWLLAHLYRRLGLGY